MIAWIFAIRTAASVVHSEADQVAVHVRVLAHDREISDASSPTGSRPASRGKDAQPKRAGRFGRRPSSSHVPTTDASVAAANAAGMHPASSGQRMFGVDVEEYMEFNDSGDVPAVVSMCINEVNTRGLDQVGLYRVPGNANDIVELKRQFDSDPSHINMSAGICDDIHVVAGCLKLYIRELPRPLLGAHLYDNWMACARQTVYNDRLYTIKDLIKSLPAANRAVLHALLKHLALVASHSDKNLMPISNLAMVFAPNICRPAEQDPMLMLQDMNSQCLVVDAMIQQVDWIFDAADNSAHTQADTSTAQDESVLVEGADALDVTDAAAQESAQVDDSFHEGPSEDAVPQDQGEDAIPQDQSTPASSMQDEVALAPAYDDPPPIANEPLANTESAVPERALSPSDLYASVHENDPATPLYDDPPSYDGAAV
jgi:hypothetical protein